MEDQLAAVLRSSLLGHIWALDFAAFEMWLPRAVEHLAFHLVRLAEPQEAVRLERLLAFAAEQRSPLRPRLDGAAEDEARFAGPLAHAVIAGPLSSRPSPSSELLGGTSYRAIRHFVAQAVAAPRVDGLLLEFDTPGGAVMGCRETFDALRAANAQKPVWAVVSGHCCSAGYWLASAARRIIASPSAEVGSVGVYGVHEDRSAQYEASGVRHTVISAGRLKAEDLDVRPLSEDARGRMQARVDQVFQDFVDCVAAGRRTTPEAVRSGYGEGAVLGARESMAAGLVDEIGTVEQAAARFADVLGDFRRRAEVSALAAR